MINVNLPVEYQQVDSLVHPDRRAIDPSEGGLLPHVSEQTEIGQPQRTKLSFSSGPGLDPISMVVEVVWADIHLGTGWGDYRCGVNFIDISLEDKMRFENWWKSLVQ